MALKGLQLLAVFHIVLNTLFKALNQKTSILNIFIFCIPYLLYIIYLFINHYFSLNTTFSTYPNSNRLDNYKNPVAL